MKNIPEPLIKKWQHYLFKKQVKSKGIQGLINKHEARLLFMMASTTAHKGRTIEIGSYFGYSTLFLAKANQLQKANKVIAIDPHLGNPEHQQSNSQFNSLDVFRRNISMMHLNDWVDEHVMTSEKAADRWSGDPVGLLWIDGHHDYEFVKLDYTKWSPFLVSGGIIAFHDASPDAGWPGPYQVVQEANASGQFTPFQYFHGIAWATKK